MILITTGTLLNKMELRIHFEISSAPIAGSFSPHNFIIQDQGKEELDNNLFRCTLASTDLYSVFTNLYPIISLILYAQNHIYLIIVSITVPTKCYHLAHMPSGN